MLRWLHKFPLRLLSIKIPKLYRRKQMVLTTILETCNNLRKLDIALDCYCHHALSEELLSMASVMSLLLTPVYYPNYNPNHNSNVNANASNQSGGSGSTTITSPTRSPSPSSLLITLFSTYISKARIHSVCSFFGD